MTNNGNLLKVTIINLAEIDENNFVPLLTNSRILLKDKRNAKWKEDTLAV